MENAQQLVELVPEGNCYADFCNPRVSVPAMELYEEVIRELDAIFDRIHGGRSARYSGR